jgi:succinate-acetate transporter protein
MKAMDYSGLIAFADLTFAVFVVEIQANNKILFIGGYTFIVMAQVAYLVAYTKTIKRKINNDQELFTKK